MKTSFKKIETYTDIFTKFIFGLLILSVSFFSFSFAISQINSDLSWGNDNYRVFAEDSGEGGVSDGGTATSDGSSVGGGGDAGVGISNGGGDSGDAIGNGGGDSGTTIGNGGGDFFGGDGGSTPVAPAQAAPTLPTCDSFTVTPSAMVGAGTVTLTWNTSNATFAAINGVSVALDGSLSLTVSVDTTYTLTAFDGVNTASCQTAVDITPVVAVLLPTCDSFTTSQNSLPAGGGNVTLTWNTGNAAAVSISSGVGSVVADGSSVVAVSTATVFTLTVTNASGSVNCAVSVTVGTVVNPTAITCAQNVNFSASPTSISRGDSTTLSWSTTGVTGVSFNNNISATGLNGSVSVGPADTTTYTLTATNGTNTIACPVTVSVSVSTSGGGGGGGGSNAPRCELSVSDNKINLGESVVLTWNSTRASNITLEDETKDDVLVTTEKLSSSAKKRLFDGTLRVSPKKDTTYVLTVKRGSSTRTCKVKVEMNNVTVTEKRDLVSGIALTEVPYTGFEAGPVLTTLFYLLLAAWALYVAYLTIIRPEVKLATAHSLKNYRQTPEEIRPDVFVATVQAPIMPVSTLTPDNLPTGAVLGYANIATGVVSSNVHNVDGEEMTKIENHAHSKRVLLSSDAIRHFIATTNSQSERTEALDQVILAAKSQFPAEDGWLVLNEKRMQELCLACAVNVVHSSAAPYVPAVIPEGSGSLAEAIVTGNIVAAYEMIGNRPMFALADAAADLDSVYRIRLGGEAAASELLTKETAALTTEQILQMINALTGALDGTYTDEAEAVKMSIMKAIKVVA